jgi:hypothetical protein
MNILTAPLALLFETPPGLTIQANLAPGQGAGPSEESMAKLFFKVGVAITLLMIGCGIYLLVKGTPGDLVVKGKDLNISTTNGGIALLVLGVLLYLGIGWLIVKKGE